MENFGLVTELANRLLESLELHADELDEILSVLPRGSHAHLLP